MLESILIIIILVLILNKSNFDYNEINKSEIKYDCYDINGRYLGKKTLKEAKLLHEKPYINAINKIIFYLCQKYLDTYYNKKPIYKRNIYNGHFVLRTDDCSLWYASSGNYHDGNKYSVVYESLYYNIHPKCKKPFNITTFYFFLNAFDFLLNEQLKTQLYPVENKLNRINRN